MIDKYNLIVFNMQKKNIVAFAFSLWVTFALNAQHRISAYLTFPTQFVDNYSHLQTSRYNPNSDTSALFVSLSGTPNDSVFLLFLDDNELFSRKLNSRGFDSFTLTSNLFYKLFSYDIFSALRPSRKLPNSFGDTTKIMARIKLTSGNPVTVSFNPATNLKYSKNKYIYLDDQMYYYGSGTGVKLMTHASVEDNRNWPGIILSNGLKSACAAGLTYTASTPFAPYFSLPYGFPGNGFVVVTAQLDSTLIEFIPGTDLLGGYKKGQTYRKWLEKGQSLWLGGTHGEISSMPNNSDISGTRLRVVNCKPVEMLNGTYWGMREFVWKTRRGFAEKPFLEVSNNYNFNDYSYRNIYSWQLPPDQALGRRYLIPVGFGPELYSRRYNSTKPPSQELEAGSYFTVVQTVALFDNTRIRINGRTLLLSKKGDSGGDTIRSCGFLESDKPVAVSYFVDPIRGSNGQGFPAFSLDNISQDTFKLNIGWNSGFINPFRKEDPGVAEYSRPYQNNAIAWVIALGEEGKGAVINVNGRKRTLAYRISRVPEPFYFDTVWLIDNTSNKIHCSSGGYVLYASEFRKTGSQNVGIAGIDFEPKWVKMKAGGKWLNNVSGIQTFCAKTPVTLEGIADWYKPEKVLWKIAGTNDTGLIVNHQFNDTGQQQIELHMKRPYDSCLGTIWDTLIRTVRIYSIPVLNLPADTTLCKGSVLNLKAKFSEMKLPDWKFRDSPICNGCGTIIKKINKSETITASISKVGCVTVSDTIQIFVYDSLNLKIIGPDSVICHGKLIMIKAKISGNSLTKGIVWNDGTNADSLRLRIGKQTKIVAAAEDVCYNTLITDTIILNTYSPLKINYPTDTGLCGGKTITIYPKISGGHPKLIGFMHINNIQLPKSFTNYNDTSFMIIAEDGCSQPDTVNLNIKILPKPKLLINGLPAKWCRNQSVNIQLTALNADTVFSRWEISHHGRIMEELKGNQISWRYRPVDNAIISVKFITSCYSIDTVISPKIPAPPAVNWQSAKTVCLLSDTIRGTLNTNINTTIVIWDNNGNIDSFETKYHLQKIISPARKKVWVAIHDQCSLSDTQIIHRPVADSLKLILPNTRYCCYPDTIILNPAAVGGLPNRSWVLQGEDGSKNKDSTLRYQPKSNHKVMVSVSDGCQEKISYFNVVVVGTSKHKIQDTQACAPLVFSKKWQLTHPSNWICNISAGSIFKGAGNNINIHQIFESPGMRQLSLITSVDSFNCPALTAKIYVLPKPLVSFTSTPAQINLATPRVNFIDNSTSIIKRNWYQNGNFVSNEKNYTTRFEDTGNYLIKLIGSNINGCIDSSMQLIRVSDFLKVYIPSAVGREQQNKIFKPLVLNGVLENMVIYSRWGEKLAEGISFNPENYPSIEVFVYRIVIRDNDGKRHYYSGTVNTLH
jgi:hypothetical protein